jgi:two-component system response regulator DevR
MAGLSTRGEGTDPAKTRVFLLEDHAMMREGLRRVLSVEPDIEVVGDAGTVASALEQLPELRPDVAILDVRLREGDGVSACRDIRSMLPDTACLMYTAYDDDQVLLSAILAGAAGCVMKDTGIPELIDAVRIVATGRSILEPDAIARVMAQLRQGTPSHDRLARNDRLASLTAQEQRVLDLIGEGLTNRQIAERMFLAEKTAKNYVSSLLAKLGLERRSQAAVVAVQQPKVQQAEAARGPSAGLGPAGPGPARGNA